jgi:putative hydrolase of the HAD superfamily
LAKLLDSIDTVFFDFGNTLAYSTHSPLEIWTKTAAEHGVELRRRDLARAIASADQACNAKVYEFRGRIEEFWDMYDSHVLAVLNLADRRGKLRTAISLAFLDAKRWLRLFPETQSVLSQLRRDGYELGIISNSTDEMVERLEILGIIRYFDTVTYSQEAGAEKPDPAPFRLALRRVGRKPEKCAHVGDSYEEDVAGARAIGMRPILLDRSGKYPGTDCAVVRDIRQVLG